jgi:integrase
LGKVDDVRSRFIVALVAVHALVHDDLPSLLLNDLDRARGHLRVRRQGRLDHIVHLDELTTELATEWLRERHRRWPRTTNPHLLVSRVSAADEAGPKVSTGVTKTVFERVGISASRLRQDRIYDEARHTADPVHLIRMFGPAMSTAMKYVMPAYLGSRGRR